MVGVGRRQAKGGIYVITLQYQSILKKILEVPLLVRSRQRLTAK